jgi:hypothetical protein
LSLTRDRGVLARFTSRDLVAMADTPNTSTTINLAFWNGEERVTTQELTDTDASPPETPTVEALVPEAFPDRPTRYGASMYVKVFEGEFVPLTLPAAVVTNAASQRCCKPSLRRSGGSSAQTSRISLDLSFD